MRTVAPRRQGRGKGRPQRPEKIRVRFVEGGRLYGGNMGNASRPGNQLSIIIFIYSVLIRMRVADSKEMGEVEGLEGVGES